MSKNPTGAAQQSLSGADNPEPASKRRDQKSTSEPPKLQSTYPQALALGKPALPLPLNPIPPKPGVPAPLIPSRAAEQHHGANEKTILNLPRSSTDKGEPPGGVPAGFRTDGSTYTCADPCVRATAEKPKGSSRKHAIRYLNHLPTIHISCGDLTSVPGAARFQKLENQQQTFLGSLEAGQGHRNLRTQRRTIGTSAHIMPTPRCDSGVVGSRSSWKVPGDSLTEFLTIHNFAIFLSRSHDASGCITCKIILKHSQQLKNRMILMDSLDSLTVFLTNALWRFFLVEKITYPTNTISKNKLKHGISIIHGFNQQLKNRTILMDSLDSLTDFLTNVFWRFFLVEKITYSTNTRSKNKLKHGTWISHGSNDPPRCTRPHRELEGTFQAALSIYNSDQG